ncbi:MAG: LeuD/DmdB family oxidoreductase small subunit [Promethearchaeota archaeon]
MVETKIHWKLDFKGKNQGKVWVFGDDISTDDIISGKYLEIRDFGELANHVFDAVVEDFFKNVDAGDIIIAGSNFGCGSSREQAPYLLKYLGIGIICAKSFARIFFRNAINIGLPVYTIDDVFYNSFSNGDLVNYFIDPPKVVNVTRNEIFNLTRFPDFFMQILQAGGALSCLKSELKLEKNGGS